MKRNEGYAYVSVCVVGLWMYRRTYGNRYGVGFFSLEKKKKDLE